MIHEEDKKEGSNHENRVTTCWIEEAITSARTRKHIGKLVDQLQPLQHDIDIDMQFKNTTPKHGSNSLQLSTSCENHNIIPHEVVATLEALQPQHDAVNLAEAPPPNRYYVVFVVEGVMSPCHVYHVIYTSSHNLVAKLCLTKNIIYTITYNHRSGLQHFCYNSQITPNHPSRITYPIPQETSNN